MQPARRAADRPGGIGAVSMSTDTETNLYAVLLLVAAAVAAYLANRR